MRENKSFFYQGKFFQYNLVWKNIKKINLRINDEGVISVSAPTFVSVEQIEKFIYQNIEFITNNSNKKRESTYLNVDLGIVSLFGVKLEIVKYLSSKNSVKIENEKLIIHYKNIDDIKKLIKKVLKKCALLYFKKQLDYHSERIGVHYNGFKVKWMKSKWGHCDQNKEILLNYKLICYDKESIDYIIIHELCHIIYMNHSEDFWNLVSLYCPNWQSIRKKIRD